MTDDDYAPTWDDMLKLADRMEAGAETLTDEADHAAEVLATRANGHLTTPEQWAADRRQAVTAVRAYAAELRADAELQPVSDPSADRFAQAELVAVAAECGGILIDGRPAAERTAQSDSYFDRAERHSWEAGTHPTQIKAAHVEATGIFAHVAETISGVEQIPFWRLVGQRPAPEQAPQ